MRRHLLLALTAVMAVGLPGSALAQSADESSPNLDLVKNIPFPAKYDDQNPNHGTDVEPVTIAGRKYVLAGSYYNGLQIIDASSAKKTRRVATYDCGILQGDVQVFKAADGTRRTLAAYTADAGTTKVDSQCFREAKALGFEPVAANGRGKQGTFLVDVTRPSTPKTVSFVEVKQGSHNITVHPSGQFLYNSNSDLITSTSPAIELIDIRDPDNPVLKGELPLAARPGLGTESHDITFSDDGKRAYSAALSHGVIIDSSNPGEPKVLTEFDDETINVWHQSDPITMTSADGTEKDFLVVEDEFAGAAGGNVCPSGGVHVYDITGDKELSPEKVGYWNIEDVRVTGTNPEDTCTAHVFDIHEDEQLMTIAFYRGGVRVVDLAGLVTGEGIKEIAKYRTEDANTWSFKAASVSRDGSWYGFGGDIARGLDVYRYDGSKAESDTPGVWLPGPALGEPGTGGRSATDAGDIAAALAEVNGTTSGVTARSASAGTTSLAGYRMNCLLK